jgi:hypothetical protein
VLTERVKANLDVVLEETCRELPHGGDHERRRVIADTHQTRRRGSDESDRAAGGRAQSVRQCGKNHSAIGASGDDQ